MHIALFISSVKNRNTGFGGHYRSLLSYYNHLMHHTEVSLMHYNELEASILDDKVENRLDGVRGIIQFIKTSKSLVSHDIEVVISFADSLQSRVLRLLCWIYGKTYIQIMPGGGSRILPLFFNSCIYFSNENLSNKTDFSRKKILLTNRIDGFECDKSLIGQLTQEYPKHDINLLRISRIGIDYYKSFVVAINFHSYLQSIGIDVQTHLIGYIDSQIVYDKLNNLIKHKENIYIITNETYTDDAKLLIDYYDVAIGIGRSFWETASKKLVVLGYSNNSELPIVINENNYESVRNYNFSERVRVDKSFSIDNNISVITDDTIKENYIKFLYSKYRSDYSTSNLYSYIDKIVKQSSKDRIILIMPSLFFILISEIYHVFFERMVRRIKLNLIKQKKSTETVAITTCISSIVSTL